MTLWDRIQAMVEDAKDRTLGAALDGMAARRAQRDEAAFSIALIALSAKMAKADGVVTDDEIAAFRAFFTFPEDEADKVRMIYSLAQQDVAGFESYLNRVQRLFEGEPEVLEDVLDCLFHVAGADGVEHPRERQLLESAAKAFKLPDAAYRRLRAVHLGTDADDPFAVLGVAPDASRDEIKSAYRNLAREHHPDALLARGVPPSLIKIAEQRMAAINAAFAKAESLVR
ncbi:MAG: molecular chaperone DjiA [Parvularculaceae bacterium]|nr:molecular chaperone DjiA [Parvularculaceae bacterium]